VTDIQDDVSARLAAFNIENGPWQSAPRQNVPRQLHVVADDFMDDGAPPPNGPEDYGIDTAVSIDAEAQPAPVTLPPLKIQEWLDRDDLSEPDCLMGSWLTTTTRSLLVAPTGLGKSNFGMALGMHVAAGKDFLHWKGKRPARVLNIDGEMSRRLYRDRIRDAVNRIGEIPSGFHALSREDLEELKPLNTPEGQAQIDQIIASIGGIDFIEFDAIMCLLAGDMKDGEAWAQVMPWVRSLTKRNIGQLWIHHTGHDEKKSYGDKTKEWQLDTVMHMEAVKNEMTDISFALEFRKAREREPANRADFQTTTIALIGNEWTSDCAKPDRKGRVSPLGLKFLDALNNVLAGEDVTTIHGCRAASLANWKAECARIGLIDPEEKPDSARNLFNKHRRELIGANHISSNETYAWTL